MDEYKKWGFSTQPTYDNKTSVPPFPPTWGRKKYNTFARFCVRNFWRYTNVESSSRAVSLIKSFEEIYSLGSEDITDHVTSEFETKFDSLLTILNKLGTKRLKDHIVSYSIRVKSTDGLTVSGTLNVRSVCFKNPSTLSVSDNNTLEDVCYTPTVNETQTNIRFSIKWKKSVKTVQHLEHIRRKVNNAVRRYIQRH